MGKIIKFLNSCSKCKYEKRFACTNGKYLKNQLEIVRKGRCPYWEAREI